MLDDYKIIQPVMYKTLKNGIIKDHLNHAYIIEANNNRSSLNIAIAFAKSIFCPLNKTDNSDCGDCTQCSNIDQKNFPELKIIESDNSLWIKKEQLDDLQNEFSKKALFSNKKVYIINNAEKLNQSSSNALLKFLEEPEENIIAILIVDNIHQLLDTVVSRCQIIPLANNLNTYSDTLSKLGHYLFNSEDKFLCFVNNAKNIEKIDQVIDFIKYFETNKLNTLLYSTSLFHNYFKEKEEILFALDVMVFIYKDIINIKLNRNIEIFNDYGQAISKIANLNSLEELYRKISVIIDSKEKIKYNANSSLLIDSLIINLGGEDK